MRLSPKLLALPVLLIAVSAARAGDFGTYTSSITIDNMSSLSAWSPDFGDDPTTLSSIATPYGPGIKMDYTFTATKGWAQMHKSIQYWKFFGTENLAFYYRKTGSAEKFYVKFKDSSGRLMKLLIGAIGDSGGWQLAQVNLTSFAPAPEGAAGTFDWTNVSNFEFDFDKSDGGTGALEVSEVRIGVSNIVLDDFEGASSFVSNVTLNARGYTSGTYGGPITAVLVSTVAFRGSRSLELNYNMSGGGSPTGGYYTNANTGAGGAAMSAAGMNQLRLWIKGAAGGEKGNIELRHFDGSGTGTSVFQYSLTVSSLTGIASISTSWQLITIDLSAYASQLSAIQSVNFNFDSTSGGPSTIYIDDIAFYNSASGQQLPLLDSMNLPVANTSWSSYSDASTPPAATTKLSSVPGPSFNAIRMDYAFNAGAWLGMSRKSSVDLSFIDGLYFPFKQSGDKNFVEIKIKDSNGSTYYLHKLYDPMDTYFVLKAPIKDFKAFQEDSATPLNLREITDIWISVARNNKASGGSFYVGSIIAATESNVFKDFGASAVMTSLDVVNNPFKVDGTGFNNAAIFKFNLSEPANIRFRVYNLKGIIIYELQNDFVAGDNSFQWNGRNNGGTLQNSGLYIYQIYAKGALTGGDQKFNNIVGIGK